MKIRNDFVTNSSSSSYIIGKKDDDVTVESVYQMIRKYYIEFHSKILEMVSYVRNEMKKDIEINQIEDGWYAIKSELKWEDNNKLEEKFGTGINSYAWWDYSWVEQCETYEDYKTYWTIKMGNSDNDYRPYAPFTIIDYSSKERVHILHLGKGGLKYKSDSGNSKSSVLEWYFNYAEEAFNHEPYKEGMYCNRGYYEALTDRIQSEKIPKSKACLYLLGKILVDSEDGYIPEYVASKLRYEARYACSHMG